MVAGPGLEILYHRVSRKQPPVKATVSAQGGGAWTGAGASQPGQAVQGAVDPARADHTLITNWSLLWTNFKHASNDDQWRSFQL